MEPVKGYMIAGPLSTSDRDLVYPQGKFREHRNLILHGKEWKIARMAINRTKDDVRFMALGFKNLDTYQHQLWKFIEPEAFGLKKRPRNEKYREIIYAEYENLDELMGRFGPEWNVFVMGDSGFEPEMSEYGYYATTYEMDFTPLLVALNYTDVRTRRVTGTKITRPNSNSELKRCPILYPGNDVVDRDTYLFRICVLEDDVNISRVMERLSRVDYRNGSDFFHDIYYNESLESIKGKIHLRRDAFIDTAYRKALAPQPHVSGKSVYIDKALGLELPGGQPFKLWIGPEKSGDHPPGTDSLFIARGPAIADIGKVPAGTVRSQDIAPTLLYLYGLPVPRGMDGEVVTRIFTEEFNQEHRVRYVNASTKESGESYFRKRENVSEQALKERLRNLG
ncbi:MAG: hypothetical protein ABEJ66_00040, partial [Candidatus Nanohaloarchaea archaeon]